MRDPAALKEIAARRSANVRRLQGAMTRVAALSSMLSEPRRQPPAREARRSSAHLGDRASAASGSPAVHGPPQRRARSRRPFAPCCSVSRQDLLSPKRTPRISHARQLAMYLARQETSLSLAQIAREFNRDHITVLHAIRRVTKRLEPGSDTPPQSPPTLEPARLRAATTLTDQPSTHDRTSPQPLSTRPFPAATPDDVSFSTTVHHPQYT